MSSKTKASSRKRANPADHRAECPNPDTAGSFYRSVQQEIFRQYLATQGFGAAYPPKPQQTSPSVAPQEVPQNPEYEALKNRYKRVKHNEFERARRMSLNTKFNELSEALPSLGSMRRPSKVVIVQKALEYVNIVKQDEDRRNEELVKLQQENVQLMQDNEILEREMNELRERFGLPCLSYEPKSKPVQVAKETPAIQDKHPRFADKLVDEPESLEDGEDDEEEKQQKKHHQPKNHILPKGSFPVFHPLLFMDSINRPMPTPTFDTMQQSMMSPAFDMDPYVMNPPLQMPPVNEVFPLGVFPPINQYADMIQGFPPKLNVPQWGMPKTQSIEDPELLSTYSDSTSSDDYYLPTPKSTTFDQSFLTPC